MRWKNFIKKKKIREWVRIWWWIMRKKNIYLYIYEYKLILNFYINIEYNIIYGINYIKNISNEYIE